MKHDPADPRIADVVRAGNVWIALFPSFFYRKNPETGELQGVGIELARALAARLGVAAALREYPSPPKAVGALKAGECDVAFLGLDPDRATEVDFSPPYMQADFTFLVPAGAAARRIADADRPGIRVAVVRDHAMDFALRGKLEHAEPVYATTPDAAFDLLRAGQADVLAGIRPGLLRYSAGLPGSRIPRSYGLWVARDDVVRYLADIGAIFNDFHELHGDRMYADDTAIAQRFQLIDISRHQSAPEREIRE